MAKVLCGSMGKYNTYGVDTGTLPEAYFGAVTYLSFNSNLPVPNGGSIEFVGIKWDFISGNNPLYRILTGNNIADIPTSFAIGIKNGIEPILLENLSPSQISFANRNIQFVNYENIVINSIANNTIKNMFDWNTSFHNPARCRSRGIIIRDASNNIVWQWLTSPSDFKSLPPNGSVVGTLGWYYQGISRHDETKEAMLAWINSTTLTENLIIWDLDQTIPAGYFPSSKDGFTITVENGVNPPVPQTGSIFPKCRCTISIGV